MANDRVDCPDCVGGRYTDRDEGGAYCSTCGERAQMTEQQIIATLATQVMGWNDDVVWLTGWNPMKNIHDAWMIVEKLYISVIPQSPGAPEDMKFLAVLETLPFDSNIEIYAKTAQEAICKAALEVLTQR